MNNEKESWIESMLKLAATSASPSQSKEVVLTRIIKILDEAETRSNVFSINQFRMAGVAALVILTINVGVIGSRVMQTETETTRVTYGLNAHNLDLY